MKTLGKLLLLGALFTFLFISCSKDEPSSTTGPDFSISDMAGNWEATKASLYNSTIDQGVAIIADDGTVSMVIQANGRFTINIDPIDRNPFTVTGKMFFEQGEWFAIQWDEDPSDYEYFGVELTATTLNIIGGPDTAEYDFDNNGTKESCNLILELLRS